MIYYAAKELSGGLYEVSAVGIGEQLWALAKTRKETVCASDGISIKKGEMAFRPVTNGANRGHRIAQKSMNRLLTVTKNQN